MKLMNIASGQLAPGAPIIEILDSSWSSEIQDDLAELIRSKNGFFAFESALHVFSAQTHDEVLGIADWNTAEVWKHVYGGRADQLLCFAEDIFANQYALGGQSIVLFDGETGQSTTFANSLDEWARRILEDYDFLTGHTFARNWQAKNGPLPPTDRLCPIRPFVVGGEYTVENMRSANRADVLRTLGGCAVQIADVPDGGKIQLHIR